MATLKQIKGTTIQFRDEDPVVYAGSWSSGGSLNTARSEFGGGGTQTSGMAAGGRNASLTNNNAEIYNGTSWTAIATTNVTQRGRLGAGADNEAFIAIGGQSSTVDVENWNGSSWTEIANLNTTKHATYGNMGTATAAIAVGYGSPNTTNEIWNGSSWTEVGDLNTGGGDLAFFGTSTSGIIAAGNRPAQVAICESWNGSSWTEVADLNQSRENGSGAGSSNSIGIVFGGYKDGTGDLANTESWNGSAWTEVNDLATARFAAGGAGTETVALCSGGRGSDTYQSATEEWSFSGIQPTDPAVGYADAIVGDFYYNSTTGQFKNVTSGVGTGTWASGGNMNTARYRMQGGMGTYTAAVAVAGASPNKANVESYNGTAWTEVNDVPSVRADVAAGGTATAGFALGGNPSPITQTLEWDGTSFSTGGAFPVSIARAATFGSQTSFVATGGASPSRSPADQSVNTLEYDGSSWTTGNNYPTILANGGGAGVLTAGMIGGGYTSTDSNGQHSCTYDGTNWTQVADLNSEHEEHGFAQQSSNTSTVHYGGEPNRATVEEWNGTAWTETNDLSTGRAAGGSAGDINNALYFGGSAASGTTNVTEEWTQSDFSIKSVTTS